MSTENTEAKARNWGKIASGISTHLGTLIVGMLLAWFGFWLTNSEPHLTMRVNDILPFQGQPEEVGIVNITVTNDGTKQAESVKGFIKIDGATIEGVKVGPEHLQIKPVVDKDKINISGFDLNPRQYCQLSALVRKTAKLPVLPEERYFAAKGITAEEQKPNEKTNNTQWNIPKLTSYVFLTIAGILFAIRAVHREISKSTMDLLIDKQNELIKQLEVTIQNSDEIRRNQEKRISNYETMLRIALSQSGDFPGSDALRAFLDNTQDRSPHDPSASSETK